MKHTISDTRQLKLMLAKMRRGEGPMRDIYKQWVAKYSESMKRRYSKFSRGGGDWKPLAPSTVRRRRKGGKKKGGVDKVKVKSKKTGGKVAILNDTGTLVQALSIDGRGNSVKYFNRGVRFGFSDVGHSEKSKASIAQIATWHQDGAGRLPKREILVPPDAELKRRMRADLVRGIRRLLKEHEAPAIGGGA